MIYLVRIILFAIFQTLTRRTTWKRIRILQNLMDPDPNLTECGCENAHREKRKIYPDLNILLVEVAECLSLSVGGLLSLLDQEAGQTARQEPGHQPHPATSLLHPEPIGYRKLQRFGFNGLDSDPTKLTLRELS
jgi:hypothetical protein